MELDDDQDGRDRLCRRGEVLLVEQRAMGTLGSSGRQARWDMSLPIQRRPTGDLDAAIAVEHRHGAIGEVAGVGRFGLSTFFQLVPSIFGALVAAASYQNAPTTRWRTAECVLRRVRYCCLLALPSVRTLHRPPACCALCPRREPSTQIVHESRVVGRTHRRPPDISPMSAGSSWSHPPQGAFIHLYFSPRYWLQHPCFRFHERRERRWCRSRFHRQLRPAGSQVS